MKRTILCALSLILPATVAGQSTDKIGTPFLPPDEGSAQLRNNSSEAPLGIELDKETYLAGEVLRAVVSVKNSTNRPIEIYDPMKGAARLELRIRVPRNEETGEEFASLEPEPLQIWTGDEWFRTPTVWLAPGQKMEQAVALCVSDAPGCHGALGAAYLHRTGHYQITFSRGFFGGSSARAYFEMKDIEIRFLAERLPGGEPAARLPLALVVRSEGQDHVVVNRSRHARDWQIKAVTGYLTDPRAWRERAMEAIFPFDRIHSGRRIDSLRIEPDPGGRAVVARWTDDRYGAMGMRIDDERKHFDAVR